VYSLGNLYPLNIDVVCVAERDFAFNQRGEAEEYLCFCFLGVGGLG